MKKARRREKPKPPTSPGHGGARPGAGRKTNEELGKVAKVPLPLRVNPLLKEYLCAFEGESMNTIANDILESDPGYREWAGLDEEDLL